MFCCVSTKNVFLISITTSIKLFGGDLFLTINALRIIEETSTSHDALQANFDSADECGNKGTLLF